MKGNRTKNSGSQVANLNPTLSCNQKDFNCMSGKQHARSIILELNFLLTYTDFSQQLRFIDKHGNNAVISGVAAMYELLLHMVTKASSTIRVY